MSYPKTERQEQFVALADDLSGRIGERAERVDRDNAFPFENFRELHRAGYLGLTIPERFGGLGADPLEFALAQERLAQACGSTGLAATMHLSLLGRFGEIELWPEEVYARVTQDVIERGALINAANSEQDLGSPSRGALPSTTAERTPTGWRINGRKRWASLSPALTYVYSLVTVIDGAEAPRRGNVLIRADAPGVRVEESWDNLGMRGTASHDIVYEDVEAPLDALLPADGSAVPGDGQAWWTFPSAATYLGIGIAARDAAVAFAKERKPNGMSGPISELQTIQHKIAEIELLLLQARTLLYETAEEWLAYPGRRADIGWRLAAAKYTVTNSVIRVTDLAMRVAGSASLSQSSPLQRYFRDARTALGHPPMEDAVLTLIGKTALGLAPQAPPAAAPAPVREVVLR